MQQDLKFREISMRNFELKMALFFELSQKFIYILLFYSALSSSKML